MPDVQRTRTIEVTTNIGCSLGCTYCPQTKLVSAYRATTHRQRSRILAIEPFKSFLRTVPADVDIHFSGFAEPWHAPDCLQMVQHAHAKGHRVAIFTTADRMTLADVDELSKIHFKRVLVHLVDDLQEMRMKVTPSILAVLERLKQKIANVEFLTLGLPNKQVAEVLGRTSTSRVVHSRAGNIEISGRTVGAVFSKEMIRLRNADTTLICREDRMFSNVLLPSGDLQFCSMDYGLEYSVGSLAKESYSKIIEGEKFRAIFDSLADRRSEFLCRRCEYAFPGRYHPISDD